MRAEIKQLDDITSLQLYDLLRLRTDVFVVEQKCAYPEIDAFDKLAWHVMLWEDKEIVACARILPPGTNYPLASIGRVAVRGDKRGQQLGKKVFELALQEARLLFPDQEIKIQAQCYLERFYQAFGFKTISKPYPDVGIMHVDMILNLEQEENAGLR